MTPVHLPGPTGAIEVLRAGALTTVQDAGRPGFAHLGVPHSGALDRAALARANELVGNPPGAAGLETTVTGVSLRAVGPCRMAVTGARASVSADGRALPMGRSFDLPAGARLDIGTAEAGVRSYLAVAGGVAVEAVLGSRSTDLLSGLGPPPLRDGDVLSIGVPAAGLPPSGPAGRADEPAWAEEITLAVSLGPRHDWFTADALATLVSTPYRVSRVSNRIALRLDGAPLERAITRELPSEGVVLGAVQVTADGTPADLPGRPPDHRRLPGHRGGGGRRGRPVCPGEAGQRDPLLSRLTPLGRPVRCAA